MSFLRRTLMQLSQGKEETEDTCHELRDIFLCAYVPFSLCSVMTSASRHAVAISVSLVRHVRRQTLPLNLIGGSLVAYRGTALQSSDHVCCFITSNYTKRDVAGIHTSHYRQPQDRSRRRLSRSCQHVFVTYFAILACMLSG